MSKPQKTPKVANALSVLDSLTDEEIKTRVFEVLNADVGIQAFDRANQVDVAADRIWTGGISYDTASTMALEGKLDCVPISHLERHHFRAPANFRPKVPVSEYVDHLFAFNGDEDVVDILSHGVGVNAGEHAERLDRLRIKDEDAFSDIVGARLSEAVALLGERPFESFSYEECWRVIVDQALAMSALAAQAIAQKVHETEYEPLGYPIDDDLKRMFVGRGFGVTADIATRYAKLASVAPIAPLDANAVLAALARKGVLPADARGRRILDIALEAENEIKSHPSLLRRRSGSFRQAHRMIEEKAIGPIRNVVENDTLRKEGLMKMHFTRLRYGLDPADAIAWAALSLVEAPGRLGAYLSENTSIGSTRVLETLGAEITKQKAYLICDALRVNHKTDKNAMGPLASRDPNASRTVVNKAKSLLEEGNVFPSLEIDPTRWFC